MLLLQSRTARLPLDCVAGSLTLLANISQAHTRGGPWLELQGEPDPQVLTARRASYDRVSGRTRPSPCYLGGFLEEVSDASPAHAHWVCSLLGLWLPEILLSATVGGGSSDFK